MLHQRHGAHCQHPGRRPRRALRSWRQSHFQERPRRSQLQPCWRPDGGYRAQSRRQDQTSRRIIAGTAGDHAQALVFMWHVGSHSCNPPGFEEQGLRSPLESPCCGLVASYTQCASGRRMSGRKEDRSQSVEVQDREDPRKRTAMKPFQASAGAVGTHTSGGRVLRCHRSGDCGPATTAPATSLGSESGCIQKPTDPPTHARGSQGRMLSAPRINRPAAEPQPASPRVANRPGTGSSVAIEVHALGSPIRL